MAKTSKMLKWIGLALALSTASVQAQNFSMPPPGGVIVGGFAVVASCAAQSLLTTKPAFGTMDQTGALCVNATVTANATTTFTAASTLPTIGAGAGAAAYESLGGAPYSQPVFGSASGGGTQVDSTHGLPVDVKASVLPTGAATAANQTAPIPDCGSLPCTNKIGVLAPLTSTSTQTKVTITTASTYQQYLASNTARKGCTIQFITASHTGFVFFGAAPGDTTTSWQLGPGQTLNCNVGDQVLTDAIQLTSSNNSDVFVVNSW